VLPLNRGSVSALTHKISSGGKELHRDRKPRLNRVPNSHPVSPHQSPSAQETNIDGKQRKIKKTAKEKPSLVPKNLPSNRIELLTFA